MPTCQLYKLYNFTNFRNFMNFTNFKNKFVLVMGLGLHGGGLSVVKWLVKHGAKVTVTDLRDKKTLRPILDQFAVLFVFYVLAKHRKSDFRRAEMIIQTPAVPSTSPYLFIAAKHDVPVENEATLFFKMSPAPILGVTGTRGKSTTTALLGQMIKRRYPKSVVCGNIRTTTMFAVLDKLTKSAPAVVELSSQQLERLGHERLSPKLAVFTNLMVDHLNRYLNIQDYFDAKANIVRWQTRNDLAVLNYDNVWARKLAKLTPARVFWFSLKASPELDRGAFLVGEELVWRRPRRQQKIIDVSELALNGEHNIANALAASAAALAFGVSLNNVRQALKSFSGLPYRQELVRRLSDVDYVNDTTATTPDATIAALKTLRVTDRPNIILIVGGEDKNLDFRALAKVIKTACRALVLLP